MKTSQGEASESQEGKLHQKFMVLQQDWDAFKQSQRPRGHRLCPATVVDALKLLDNSPRSLMSSLQHSGSEEEEGSSEVKGYNKMMTRSLLREEILWDRKAAIEGGKLRGRRLFPPAEEEEMGCLDLVQESEERSVSSYGCYVKETAEVAAGGGSSSCGCCSFSGSSSLINEEVEREEKAVVNNFEVERDGERKMLQVGWFSIALIMFVLSIICMRCFGGRRDDSEVMLFPT